MIDRDQIVSAIKQLKAEKPEGWIVSCRKLFRDLRALDDPYGEHEFHGSEERGRHNRRASSCPRFDNFGDESEP